MAKDLTQELKAILDDFSLEVQEEVNKVIDDVSKEAVKKLKDSSPKKSGKYARGWTRKQTKGSLGVREVTIYNGSEPWKTHLLENGHVLRNKKGEYGRVAGISHIAPVEEWAVDEVEKRIKKDIGK